MQSIFYPDLFQAQSPPQQHSTEWLAPRADSSRRASTGSVAFNTHDDFNPIAFQVPGSYPQPIYSPERSSDSPDDREESDDDDEPASCPSAPQRGSQSINADIEAFLSKTAGVGQLKHRTGHVYVLLATHNGAPIIKIGSTENQVKTRRKNIQASCTPIFQTQPFDLPHQHIASYLRHVEKLTHAELQDFRYHFDCACGKKHREWFAIDPTVAYRAVGRWIRFCKQKPWACHSHEPDSPCTGPLKGQWRDRLDHWRPGFSTAAAARDLGTRLALWDGFVDASSWDVAWNDVRSWSRGVWRYLTEAVLVLVLGAVSVVCQRWDELRVVDGAMSVLVAALVCVVLKVGGFRCWMAERLLMG